MTPILAATVLVGLLILILALVWLIARAEDAADAEAERVAEQLRRVHPPEGAVKPAEPTYGSDNGDLVGVWHPRSTESKGVTHV